MRNMEAMCTLIVKGNMVLVVNEGMSDFGKSEDDTINIPSDNEVPNRTIP